MNLRFSATGWGKDCITFQQLSWLFLLLLSVAQSVQTQPFIHPDLLHKHSDFDRMKIK